MRRTIMQYPPRQSRTICSFGELLYRKMMGYPPLVRLLTIGLSSKREADVIRASEDMKRVILREYALDGLKVIGQWRIPLQT